MTNTYDSRGHLLTSTSGTSVTSYTYDAMGRDTGVPYESDFDGDGVIDGHSYSRTHDALAQDYAATGDYWQSSSFTYDTHGRVLTTTTEHDYGADGVPQYRSVETQTYRTGNLTLEVEESFDGDGVLQSRTIKTNTY